MTVQSLAVREPAPAPSVGRVSWYVGDLLTGKFTTQVPLVETQWSLVMDDAEQMQGVAMLADESVRALDLWHSAAMARSFLAWAYVAPDGTETFQGGGPVWTHAYNAAKRTLTLGAAGLWSYFDHRKVIQVLHGLNPATVTAVYGSQSLGTIAKRLVQLAQTHTGGNLPIVLPADEVAANDDAHTRAYPGYELDWVGDMLRNLTDVTNGPEIRFRPQRNPADARYLQWVLDVGTEEDPLLHQAGADHFWDAGLERGPVADVDVTGDGTAMAGRAWVRGNGDAEGTLIGVADDTTLIDAGYPLLEVDVAGHESDELAATVNAAATGGLLPAAGPAITLVATVARDQAPALGDYRVGDYGQVNILAHDYLPDDNYRSRITQIAGDDSDFVKVDFTPIIGSLSV